MTEAETQKILCECLKGEGWKITKDTKGKEHGVDIIARKNHRSWYIEVKGEGKKQKAQNYNHFVYALGQIILRMDKPSRKYSIAFPDIKKFRVLWEKVPKSIKKRLKISMILVKTSKEKSYEICN